MVLVIDLIVLAGFAILSYLFGPDESGLRSPARGSWAPLTLA